MPCGESNLCEVTRLMVGILWGRAWAVKPPTVPEGHAGVSYASCSLTSSSLPTFWNSDITPAYRKPN